MATPRKETSGSRGVRNGRGRSGRDDQRRSTRLRNHAASGEQGIRGVRFYLCVVEPSHHDRGEAVERFVGLRRGQFAAANETLLLPPDIARQIVPDAHHCAPVELIDGAP